MFGIRNENKVLVLIDKATPYYIFVPATPNQTRGTTIVPTILPVGFKTVLQDGRQGPNVPERSSTALENRKIRSLIKEAIEVHYQKDNPAIALTPDMQDFYESLDAPEARDFPMTVGQVQYLFSLDDQEGDEEAGNLHREVRRPRDLPPIDRHLNAFANIIANHPTIDQLIAYSPSGPIGGLPRGHARETSHETEEDSLWRSFTNACWYTTAGVGQSLRLILMKANRTSIACNVFFSSGIGGTLWLGGGMILTPSKKISKSRYISPFQFACDNHNFPLLNRTIDMTDHLIGLKMYKEYAELRYHYLNSTNGDSFFTDLTGFDCQRYYLQQRPLFPGDYSPYEKQLIRHFGRESKFFDTAAFSFNNNKPSYVGTGLPRYEQPFMADCFGSVPMLQFNAENLDWVYANLVELDGRLLYKEMRTYEKEALKKYLTLEKQTKILEVFPFLFDEGRHDLFPYPGLAVMFDARLDSQEKELIKRREELKGNMIPVLRDYQGIDLKQCWEMVSKKYNDAKSEETRKEKNEERAWEDSHKNWTRSFFMIGFGGFFLLSTRIEISSVVQLARNNNDALVRAMDRSFYHASQAAQNLKISMGLVAPPLSEKLILLKEAQQRDEALLNVISETLNSVNITHEPQLVQIGERILDAISAGIRNRATIIQKWEARIH